MLNFSKTKTSKSKNKAVQWIIPEHKLIEILQATEEEIPKLDIEKTGAVLSLNDLVDEKQIWKLIIANNEFTGERQIFILDPKRSLGKGGEGEVVLAQNIASGELVAVKVQRENQSITFDEDLERERRNLRLYKNKPHNIPRLISTAIEYIGNESIEFTIMNYAPGRGFIPFLYVVNPEKKDTPDYYVSKKELTDAQIDRLTILILEQYIDLHEAGLIHRDIKSDNFVLDDIHHFNTIWRKIALVDLGSALIAAIEKSSHLIGTFPYIAPEMYQLHIKGLNLNLSAKDFFQWDFSCDAYSLGMVLAELRTKYNFQKGAQEFKYDLDSKNEKKPLPREVLHQLMPDVFNNNSVSTDVQSTQIDLIHKLTDEDRTKRPGLIEMKSTLAKLKSMERTDSIERRYMDIKYKESNSFIIEPFKKERREKSEPSTTSPTMKVDFVESASPREKSSKKYSEKTFKSSSKLVRTQEKLPERTPNPMLAKSSLATSDEKINKDKLSLENFRGRRSFEEIDEGKIKEQYKLRPQTQDDISTGLSLKNKGRDDLRKRSQSNVAAKKRNEKLPIEVKSFSSINEVTTRLEELCLGVELTDLSYSQKPNSMQTDRSLIKHFDLQVERVLQVAQTNKNEKESLRLELKF